MRKRLVLCGLMIMIGAMTAVFSQTFRHPGLLHSEEDFENIKARIAAGDEQTLAALEVLKNAPGVRGNHGGIWGVNDIIKRGISGDENYMNAYRNAHRAYQLALLWKLTGDENAATGAIEILNAYRIWNKALGGNTNISLIPGFTGYEFINAAEIMRDYDKWPKEEFELFKQYMIDVWFTVAQDFLERRHDTVWREQNWYHYHSNWGLGNAMFCISLGVLCDLPDLYNYGMYWLKEGPGNESVCVTSLHPEAFGQGLCGYGWGLIPWFHKDARGPLGYFCQMQESGRDQGHSMAALGLLSYALQIAYNQGDNAFCNLYNPLIPGKAGAMMVAGAAEYVAAYNSGMDDLPYATNWWMAGLNGTGRGQWRPIWQLFINHYKNRMGIDMPYCQTMKNMIGIEGGGGAYGGNSGHYDHTGFGDLMHYDTPVSTDKVPTIIMPTISGTGINRRYAEIRNVEPGTKLTLTASVMKGEMDTGNWKWDDGSEGNQRVITADNSRLYRVTYTNENGVKSEQMFSVAVRGEGVRGTLNVTATYNGRPITGENVLMGVGRQLTVTTSYTNWNFIEREEWFDENGNLLGTGGSYTYTLKDDKEHRLIFRLTNESGVKIERTFKIIPNENDLTMNLADPDCKNLDLWTTNVDGFQKMSTAITGFSSAFIERFRPAEEDGVTCWGQEPFKISQTIEGLTPGKYELGAMMIATQQSKVGVAAKEHVKDVYLYADGVNTPIATIDNTPEFFSVMLYVGEDGKFTFGAKNLSNQNYGNSANGANWFAMDNYTLMALGTDHLEEDLARMRQEAEAIAETSVTGGMYAKLQDLKSLTGNDIATAVTYQRVLGEAKLIQARYSEFITIYNRYKAHVDENNVTCEPLTEAMDALMSADDAEKFYAAYDAMERAWVLYLENAEVQVDLTSKVSDADFPASGADVWFDETTAWKTEALGGNYRIFPIDGSDTKRGDALDVNMIERWCTGSFGVGERVIYQVLSNMPIGAYRLEVATQKEHQTGCIELYANEGVSYVMSVAEMRKHSVVGEVTDGKLDIGLRSAPGNACRWTTMSDVNLVYYSPVMMLKTVIAEAETLTYGTDAGTLQKALAEAETLLSEGEATERMSAYHALKDAIKQYRIANASEAYPVDMTEKVKNASLDMCNTTHWMVTSSDAGYPMFNMGVAEFYHSTFDLSQVVNNLPVGNYRVSMQARSNMAETNKGFYLYAKQTGGAAIKEFATDATIQEGADLTLHLGQNADQMNADLNGGRISVNVFSTDGKLTIGAACEQADMWCVLNDFRIEFLGFGENDLLKNWSEVVAQVGEINRDSIPQAVEQLLDNALNVDVQNISADSLSKALAKLSAVAEQANSVKMAYGRYLAMKNVLEVIAENSVPTYSSTMTTFKKAIATAETDVEKAKTQAEINAHCEKMEAARQAYVVGAVPINGIGFDYTFKVPNASGKVEGTWLTDGTGNFRPMNNAEQNGEYAGNWFFEKWDIEGYIFNGGTRPIYQVVTGLPNGNYTLTMAAFRVNQFGTEYVDDGINVYLNSDKVEVTSDVLNYYTVNGVVTSKKAEIGLVAGTVNTANWVGLADVSLMYYGVSDVLLSENDAELTVQDGLYCNATVEQEMTADGWNLVTLPFDLTSAQVKKVFADVKALDAIDIAEGICDIKFVDVREMKAGVPYLVQVKASVSSITYEKVRIDLQSFNVGEVSVTSGDVTLTLKGTSGVTTLDNHNAFRFTGKAFFRAETGDEVKGLSGYALLEGANNAHIMNVYVDGDLVSIQRVRSEQSDEKVSVYSISGTLLRNNVKPENALKGLSKGVYIVNGKKKVVN